MKKNLFYVGLGVVGVVVVAVVGKFIVKSILDEVDDILEDEALMEDDDICDCCCDKCDNITDDEDDTFED